MKKRIYLGGILFLVMLIVSGCLKENKVEEIKETPQDTGAGSGGFEVRDSQSKKEISNEEKEFNESGRAKAIENESDLWPFYDNNKAGFSFQYPHDVSMKEDSIFKLSVEVASVEGLEGTMGYNEEMAILNMDHLQKGEYGEEVDFPFELSKKLVSIKNINAQDFLVLGIFEVCDLRFERKLYFFNNNKQVVITLSISKEDALSELSSYTKTDKENCGDDLVWDHDRQEDFYKDLVDGKLTGNINKWYSLFDQIVETIDFDDVDIAEEEDALLGRWISVDDEKSMIKFTLNKKIDYYNGEVMSESDYRRDVGKYDVVVSSGDEDFNYNIVNINKDELELIYLPAGKILKYKKINLN